MSVIDKLASSLSRRDEVPNQELARQIADAGDRHAVQELVDHLGDKQKAIQSDCIKTLYEVGSLQPSQIAPYAADFVRLLDSKNNRLQWGAMAALNSITPEDPDTVFPALARLEAVADAGSVITRDHYVGILTKLCTVPACADAAFELLNGQLKSCPPNQLPMYAENALPVVQGKHADRCAATLAARLVDLEKESKRRRVEKVIAKLQRQAL